MGGQILKQWIKVVNSYPASALSTLKRSHVNFRPTEYTVSMSDLGIAEWQHAVLS